MNSAHKKSGLVAIAGRPNVGKSTLLNRILGRNLSIATPKAQTTRHQIKGIYTEDPGQIVFVDTPGIHRAKSGGINDSMMNEVRVALEDPSLIWYLVEPDYMLKREREVLELIQKSCASRVPVLLLLNKSDLSVAKNVQLDQVQSLASELKVNVVGTYLISARSGAGISELMARTWDLLPQGPFLYPDHQDSLSDRPMRFFVAEAVRKQLFHCLGEEIPYSCAVEITRFDESAKPIRIEALIHVERESQKGMVIGARGVKIKEIGQKARQDIEKLMGQQVFLGLKVNTLKDWTRDAQTLKRLGYFLPEARA